MLSANTNRLWIVALLKDSQFGALVEWRVFYLFIGT